MDRDPQLFFELRTRALQLEEGGHVCVEFVGSLLALSWCGTEPCEKGGPPPLPTVINGIPVSGELLEEARELVGNGHICIKIVGPPPFMIEWCGGGLFFCEEAELQAQRSDFEARFFGDTVAECEAKGHLCVCYLKHGNPRVSWCGHDVCVLSSSTIKG